MALWSVAFLGSRPIAAAVNGGIADVTSPLVAFLVVAALVGTVAAFVRPTRLAARPAPSAADLRAATAVRAQRPEDRLDVSPATRS
jgi:hypothetical protein